MLPSPPPAYRWTRDYLFDILRELSIHHVFGVPGTNEIPLIDGTYYPANEVTYIECLHENIAMGAAMGLAGMTDLPGVVVLHTTPDIAHSIGNLFDAARSHVPLVVICCQQQNELMTQEPLLASNPVDLARQHAKWAHEVRTPEEMPLVLQRAFQEAMAPPAGPVFVAVPWEFTMQRIGENDHVAGVTRISPHFTGDQQAIGQAAHLLAQAQHPPTGAAARNAALRTQAQQRQQAGVDYEKLADPAARDRGRDHRGRPARQNPAPGVARQLGYIPEASSVLRISPCL